MSSSTSCVLTVAALLLVLHTVAPVHVSGLDDDQEPTKTILEPGEMGLDGTETPEEERRKIDEAMRKRIKGETVYFRQGTGPDEFRDATENIVIGGDKGTKGDKAGSKNTKKTPPTKKGSTKGKTKKKEKKSADEKKKKPPTRPGHGPMSSDGSRPHPSRQRDSAWLEEPEGVNGFGELNDQGDGDLQFGSHRKKTRERMMGVPSDDLADEDFNDFFGAENLESWEDKKKMMDHGFEELPQGENTFFGGENQRNMHAKRMMPDDFAEFPGNERFQFEENVKKMNQRRMKEFPRRENNQFEENKRQMRKKRTKPGPLDGFPDDPMEFLERETRGASQEKPAMWPDSMGDFAIDPEEFRQRERRRLDKLYGTKGGMKQEEVSEELREKLRRGRAKQMRSHSAGSNDPRDIMREMEEFEKQRKAAESAMKSPKKKTKKEEEAKQSNVEDGRLCPKHLYQCKSGECVLPVRECDGQKDCLDGSDESDCFKGRGSRLGKSGARDVPEDFVCPHNLFTCHNKECVLSTYRCDGTTECSDGSDEWDCSKDEL